MINGISIISNNLSLPFVKFRSLNYSFSLVIVAATVVFLIVRGLNVGVDFKGGVLLEVQSISAVDLSTIRHKLNDLQIGDVSLQEFGSKHDLLIRLENPEGHDGARLALIQKVMGSLGPDFTVRRTETVGPKAGQELVSNGIQAILWGLLAMLVYVWIRFEWQFGVAAIMSLLHDAVAVVGFYVFFNVEFNMTAIVAILTTIGYSINDTVVIFDRIRENLRKYGKKDESKSLRVETKNRKKPGPQKYEQGELTTVIDRSINETLSRTILTSGSTLIALLALYFFGGEVIANYSLPIIVGVAIGTYSSICVSAPLLLLFGLNRPREEDDKEIEAETV